MPELETSIQMQTAEVPATVSVRETRFDPPHEVSRGDSDSAPLGDHQTSVGATPGRAAPPGAEAIDAALASFTTRPDSETISPELVEQFRSQAEQLAAHLQARQRELDRREAELHARLAQHDTAARNARLWFQERHHDLMERQSQLDEREVRISDRLAELDHQLEVEQSATQATFDVQKEQASSLSLREDQLAIRDLDLQQRQSELDASFTQINDRERSCEARDQLLQQRDERLKLAESALARSQVEFDDARRQFFAERSDFHSRCDQQQQKIAEQYHRTEHELQKQRETLASRTQHLERRGASLDQLRSELMRVQREALEMRLATEELWAEMSSMAPPATMTQSLARLRSKLAEHYKMQLTDIAAQRNETEDLATKVAQQHQRLAAQKQEFEAWTAAQQHEVESQAARLVAREEELEREQLRIQQLRAQWDAQRHELERELRQVRSELRSHHVAATAN